MPVDKKQIKIDYTRDNLFPEIAKIRLRDSYLAPGETSPQEAFARVAAAFADDLEHAQRIYDYASQHWFMFSTPILSNGGTDKGLGISCFLQNVEDSLEGLAHHHTESMFLTARGGGLGGYWGNVRTSGGKSNGMIPWLKMMDTLMLAGNQTDTRRGSYAAYLPVSHPEIEDFIDIRDVNGDHSRRALSIGFHNAVVITDDFMLSVEHDTDWPLIDPHSKKVTKVVKARDLWSRILTARRKTGEPYIMWYDTANRYFNAHLKSKGLKVVQSNLCNEIYLPSGVDYAGKNRTAICCLSSLNASKWKDFAPNLDQIVEDLIRFLDNVLQHFIENAPAAAEQAAYAASMTRDLGLGMMGFHELLQKEMIPFESAKAVELNNEIFYSVRRSADKASQKLGEEKGYYPDAYKDGVLINKFRNAHKLALAPNASSAIVCGNTSPSIEPWRGNAFKHTTISGSFLTKNKVLEALLETRGANTEEIWKSILGNDGSVQHLQCLSDDEKLVFKTAFEMDQLWIVEHAATRQMFIDQGQSVNLFFDNSAPAKVINEVHMSAWKKELKGLYYLRTRAQKSNERISIIKSRETVDPDSFGCLACEG
jgi:ribonucleoside-diphosphate reductase alpha chain